MRRQCKNHDKCHETVLPGSRCPCDVRLCTSLSFQQSQATDHSGIYKMNHQTWSCDSHVTILALHFPFLTLKKQSGRHLTEALEGCHGDSP